MPDFLVCPPDFFEVAYTINPYMAPHEWAAKKEDYHRRARAEWYRFIRELLSINIQLHYLPPCPGIPDLVFTANGGTILDKKVLLARFKHTQRQSEEPYFLTMFEKLVEEKILSEIIPFPEGIAFEGCGDCIWDPYRKFFWFGYGQRSDLKAVDIISKVFNVKVIPLELTSSLFYHLDTCFCPLTNKNIMLYPNAFRNATINLIDQEVGWDNVLVPHDWSDITKLSMNAVNIENNIIFSRCSSDLEFRLYEKGFNVRKTPLDSFLKSGGGPACLSLNLSNTSH